MAWPPILPSMRKVPPAHIPIRGLQDICSDRAPNLLRERIFGKRPCPVEDGTSAKDVPSQNGASKSQAGAQPIASAPQRAAPPPPQPTSTRAAAATAAAEAIVHSAVIAANAQPKPLAEAPPESLLQRRRKVPPPKATAAEPKVKAAEPKPKAAEPKAVPEAATPSASEDLAPDGTPPRRSGRKRTQVVLEELSPVKVARPSTQAFSAERKGPGTVANTQKDVVKAPSIAKAPSAAKGKSATQKAKAAELNKRMKQRAAKLFPLKSSPDSYNQCRQLVIAEIPIADIVGQKETTVVSGGNGLSSRPKRMCVPRLEEWRGDRLIYKRDPLSATPEISAVECNLAPKETWDAQRSLPSTVLQAPIKTKHSAIIHSARHPHFTTWNLCLKPGSQDTVKLDFKANSQILLFALDGTTRYCLEDGKPGKEVKISSGDMSKISVKGRPFAVLAASLDGMATLKVVEVTHRSKAEVHKK